MTGLICISCNKIPGWVTWEKRQIKDATGEYEVTLSSRAVSVSRSSDQKIIWKSQKGVKVQDDSSMLEEWEIWQIQTILDRTG